MTSETKLNATPSEHDVTLIVLKRLLEIVTCYRGDRIPIRSEWVNTAVNDARAIVDKANI